MPNPLDPGGVKTFEQVVMPQNAEIKELPGFSLSYFDPQLKQYRTLKQGPTPIRVLPSTSVAQQPTIIGDAPQPAPRNNTPRATDIIHIKPHMGTVAVFTAPLIDKPWFWALQGVPVAGWLTLVFRRKNAERLANNPRLRRKLHVAKLVEDGLKDLHHAAKAGDAQKFYVTLFRLVQEQLGERLDLPASAITESVIDEELRHRKVAETIISDLERFFQICNQTRYGLDPSGDDLTGLATQVDSTLRQLRETEFQA